MRGWLSQKRQQLSSPINRRRLDNFRSNKRGYWSFWIFAVLFVITISAEFVANERPLFVSYKGQYFFPVLKSYYPESTFGEKGTLAEKNVEFRDEWIQGEIRSNGWMLWPPIRYGARTINWQPPRPLPAPPSWTLTGEQRCGALPSGVNSVYCTVGNWNWLGTDDIGRDVLARAIYGFRISVLYGLILTALAALVGIVAGAVQGYFGGWIDLSLQRFIEIWSSMPFIFVVMILSAVLTQGFWTLLGIMLLFTWTYLVDLVRAEFLRGRNFEYVRAARALGLSDWQIMFRHLLPNAMVATLTFLPFMLSGAITSLTALDFLGLGMPPDEPSLGRLLQQGKDNQSAPWLGLTAFFVVATMLSLLIFIGEAVRDALDPRKTFR
ncbi:MAG: ABC transporter permease [Hyphomicrobiaceae bacterium]|nr:MAG: ABC transporter permease [Hyphomicrobiaceae bacterium]